MSAEEAGSRMYAYGQELIAAKRARADRRHAVGRRERDARRRDPPRSPTSSCTCSSACCSARARRPPATPSRAGCWRSPTIPTSSRRCAPISSLLPTAVEEMVRWTSPSPSKRRTATRDVELGGCADRGRAEGADLGGLGQPRRRRRSTDADVVRRRAEAEPALGFRPGRALLPRRQPGAAGVAGAVRGAARPVLVGRASSSRWSGPAATGTPASATWSSNWKRETRRIRGGDGDRHRVDRRGGPRVPTASAMCWSVVAVALFAALIDRGDGPVAAGLSTTSMCHVQLLTFVAACAVVGTRLSLVAARGGRAARLAVASADGASGDVAISVDRPSRPRTRRLGTGQRRDVRAGDRRRGSRSASQWRSVCWCWRSACTA